MSTFNRRLSMAKYYKLRYTFGEDINETEDISMAKQALKTYLTDELPQWKEHLGMIDYSYGVEFRDKFGEQTKRHIHIHFSSDKELGGMRRWLTRRWKSQGEERTRASLYSFVEEDDVKDEDRFYRYPLKQCKDPMFNTPITLHRIFVQGINKEKAEELRKLAYDEWVRLCEINIKKRDTQLNKDSTYSKIEKYLGQMDISTYGQVRDKVIEFYMKEGMAINVNTIAGYIVTYSLNRGFVDPSRISDRLDKIIFG